MRRLQEGCNEKQGQGSTRESGRVLFVANHLALDLLNTRIIPDQTEVERSQVRKCESCTMHFYACQQKEFAPMVQHEYLRQESEGRRLPAQTTRGYLICPWVELNAARGRAARGTGRPFWMVRRDCAGEMLLSGEAALLTGAIGVAGAGGVGRVRPFALDLPLRIVREGDERGAEGPCAFVAVLRPEESYQAPGLAGSVRASESSWPLTLAMAAKPCECSPEVSPGSQPASPSSLKK